MSVWTKDNCIITAKGNNALTEISAKGGTMTFDSVWTCDTRVDPTELYELADLPSKNQRMTLTKYTQVSSGYTLNVQVTNEDLTEPYAIEMVGVYVKLNGFNDGNPFLYMVLLTEEGTADQMTNTSRSTYKYAIYLYHTNKAVLNITLNSQDYVATETFNEELNKIKGDLHSMVYHATFYSDSAVGDNEYAVFTEHCVTNPFVLPSKNTLTKFPIVIIRNFTGTLSYEGTLSNITMSVDDVPFSLVPYNYEKGVSSPFISHNFINEDLICTVVDDHTLKVTNYFDDKNCITKDNATYTNFNALPFKEGVYSLSGTATNAPITLTTSDVWVCSIFHSGSKYIVLALNTKDNNIYRRYINLSATSWSSATSWVSIGGSGGIQTATATFVSTRNVEDTAENCLRIMRDDTTNALKAGDVIMCTLSKVSSRTDDSIITVRFLDSSSIITKYIYGTDNSSKIICCQIPKYFLLQYDGTNFHMLTPLNITTTLSTSDPEITTVGKYGDIWYTY